MIETDEPRDGPTAEFRQHHEVITRAGSAGKRVRTRLEKLLLGDSISPQESEAGLRFAWSYAVGCNAGVRSCLGSVLGGGGAGGGGVTDTRHQAFVAYDEARKVLDGRTNPQVVLSAPSNVLTNFCVYDLAFSEIGEGLGVTAAAVKRRILGYLTALADHYAAVDRVAGRCTTAQTHEEALRRFEPGAERRDVEKGEGADVG